MPMGKPAGISEEAVQVAKFWMFLLHLPVNTLLMVTPPLAEPLVTLYPGQASSSGKLCTYVKLDTNIGIFVPRFRERIPQSIIKISCRS
jgi:hypothetical protein